MESLLAECDGRAIGHVCFSPVTIDGQIDGWFGLGPVSVLPAGQGEGTGSALIRNGLRRLRQNGARGCVVLGEPGFYSRFGFWHHTGLEFPGAPAEDFMALRFVGFMPRGEIRFQPAFYEI